MFNLDESDDDEGEASPVDGTVIMRFSSLANQTLTSTEAHSEIEEGTY